MKRFFITIVLLSAICLFGQVNVFGQQTIKGKVTDASTSESLIGASVLIKGSTQGTVTNIDGEFTLDVDSDTGTVVISYIGYLDHEQSYRVSQEINVALVPDLATLEEVVVVAYGTQKKSHLTGAVAS